MSGVWWTSCGHLSIQVISSYRGGFCPHVLPWSFLPRPRLGQNSIHREMGDLAGSRLPPEGVSGRHAGSTSHGHATVAGQGSLQGQVHRGTTFLLPVYESLLSQTRARHRWFSRGCHPVGRQAWRCTVTVAFRRAMGAGMHGGAQRGPAVRMTHHLGHNGELEEA